MKINTSSVIFRDDLYPRTKHDPVTVQKYAEDLTVLPPIEVNQHNELIDGWHRWTAHKKNEALEIEAKITQTTSDAHLLELAIERNASHGLQLSQEDKRDMARRIYATTPERDRDEKKTQLSKILSVSERTVRDWLSRIDKDTKEKQQRAAFELWLACCTQEEIAAQVGAPQRTVADWLESFSDFGNLAESAKSAANHATDFTAPIYNVWKQQEKSNSVSHFGNSEVRWLDNLLYLYTKPFDVVIDPFTGGGSTIDICQKRFRRYFASDRKPIVERAKEIRQHDVTTGLPKPPQWKDVSLVYLDPPYWRQSKGEYSNDPTDLANMPLEQFNVSLSKLIKDFASKLRDDARIALMIQPTQWNAPERAFIDHVGDMLRMVKLPMEMRFSVPYESQQCNAQMVEWAKKEKRCLVLTREIVVWRCK